MGDVRKANGDGTAARFDEEGEGYCREVSLDGDEVRQTRRRRDTADREDDDVDDYRSLFSFARRSLA